MNFIIAPFVLTLAVVLLVVRPCAADDTIVWGVVDNPPYHIIDGPGANTGYSDLTRLFFSRHLPEFKHRTIELSLIRLLENARNGESYAYCNLRKTPEREKLFYYSDVTVVIPAPRLYVREDSPILDMVQDGTISLVDLLKSGRFVGISEKGRSYGPEIEKIFSEYGSPFCVRATPNTERIHELVSEGRADFYIEYSFILQQYLKDAGLESNLVPVKIAEHPPYVLVYAVCTRNEFGKKVIERINEVLRRTKGTAEYREMFLRPAENLDERSKSEYENLYEVFLKLK